MSKSRQSLFALLLLVVTLFGAGGASSAAARRVPPQPHRGSISSFFNPEAPGTGGLLGSGGPFSWAGGVILRGHAAFYEQSGERATRLSITDLALSSSPDGEVFITRGSEQYQLEVHPGLACPLARFVRRDGLVAYTQPIQVDQTVRDKIRQAGLVSLIGSEAFIAREFRGTAFERLISSADFFDEESLPAALARRAKQTANQALGSGRSIAIQTNWYFNTDMQVTYRTNLVVGTGRADIVGVPLRYYWSFAQDRSGVVDSVKIMAQTWPDGASLSTASPTQYDWAAFYQAAGVFRQFSLTNRPAFDRFVIAACGS
jgi:hypothetical protein